MLTVHRLLALLVIAVSIVAALLALFARRQGGTSGMAVAHALALAQTLVVAEVAFGLLLLADDRHAAEGSTTCTGASPCSPSHGRSSMRPRSRVADCCGSPELP